MKKRLRSSFGTPVTAPSQAGGFQLAIKPFPIALGAVSPATASAEFSQGRYDLHLSGGAELGRLLTVAQTLGVRTPGIGLEGSAQLDLEVAGEWMGFAEPTPTGKMQISTVTAELQGVSEPLAHRRGVGRAGE